MFFNKINEDKYYSYFMISVKLGCYCIKGILMAIINQCGILFYSCFNTFLQLLCNMLHWVETHDYVIVIPWRVRM